MSHARSPEAVRRREIEALKIINVYAEAVPQAIGTRHPDAGECLPLPAFDAPTSQADLERILPVLHDNLFDRADNRAQQWIDARRGCPHLTGEQVTDIFELIYTWYQLLAHAKCYIATGADAHFLREPRIRHQVRVVTGSP